MENLNTSFHLYIIFIFNIEDIIDIRIYDFVFRLTFNIFEKFHRKPTSGGTKGLYNTFPLEIFMLKKSITSFFEEFLDKESLFSDRSFLLSSYVPENILHRDNEVNRVANILAPALKQEKPSNWNN